MPIPRVLKYWKILLIFLFAIIVTLSFLFYRYRTDNATNYSFVTITRGNVESTISSSGTLNPVTEITVGTQVSGTIEKVFVDFNDKVVKGQIIALLDSALLRMSVSNAEADSLKAEAKLEEAQINYRRNEQLFTKGLISESDFQPIKTTFKTAQSDYMNARTALQRAVQNLDYSVIRSPITGTVTARNIEAGQTVAASFATPTLFTIAQDLSKMEITAAVDESDIGQIKEGQAVRFNVQAYPAKTFTGVVKQVRLKPTTASNVVNYTVIVTARNDENLLLPGMTATVEFIIEQKLDVLVVANTALRFQLTEKEMADFQKQTQSSHPPERPDTSTGEWKQLWYLDENGKLAVAPVQVGISDGSQTEILGKQFSVGMKIISSSESDSKTITPAKSTNNGPPPMM